MFWPCIALIIYFKCWRILSISRAWKNFKRVSIDAKVKLTLFFNWTETFRYLRQTKHGEHGVGAEMSPFIRITLLTSFPRLSKLYRNLHVLTIHCCDHIFWPCIALIIMWCSDLGATPVTKASICQVATSTLTTLHRGRPSARSCLIRCVHYYRLWRKEPFKGIAHCSDSSLPSKMRSLHTQSGCPALHSRSTLFDSPALHVHYSIGILCGIPALRVHSEKKNSYGWHRQQCLFENHKISWTYLVSTYRWLWC